jgi:CHAD domain-containing protein
MGFHLDLTCSLDAAVTSVAREELAAARTHLLSSADDLPGAVHEARKSLKRVRALLRLVRSGVDDGVRRDASTVLRDIGRRLSVARDAAVAVETLDRLLAEHAQAVDAAAFAALRALLHDEHIGIIERLRATGEPRAIAEAIERVEVDVDRWTCAGEHVLREGVARSAGRASTAYEAVCSQEPSDEALHTWRKRLKDLRYHVELLVPAWPALLMPLEQALHDLTDLVGDDHDLAVLHATANARPGGFHKPAHRGLLDDLIRGRRAALQRAAFDLGTRVHVERPKALARRLSDYVECAAAR